MLNKTSYITALSSSSIGRNRETTSKEKSIKEGIIKTLLTQRQDVHAKKGVQEGTINVHVEGKTVTLAGTVESWVTSNSIASIVSKWNNKPESLKRFGQLEIKNQINIENQNRSVEAGCTPLFSDFDDLKKLERMENGDPEPVISEMI